jgi:hypothetical protein
MWLHVCVCFESLLNFLAWFGQLSLWQLHVSIYFDVFYDFRFLNAFLKSFVVFEFLLHVIPCVFLNAVKLLNYNFIFFICFYLHFYFWRFLYVYKLLYVPVTSYSFLYIYKLCSSFPFLKRVVRIIIIIIVLLVLTLKYNYLHFCKNLVVIDLLLIPVITISDCTQAHVKHMNLFAPLTWTACLIALVTLVRQHL